jgi:hypothetical protein
MYELLTWSDICSRRGVSNQENARACHNTGISAMREALSTLKNPLAIQA